MRRPRAHFVWAAIAVAVASSGISAAQTCPTAPLWQLPAQPPSTITQVASDTPFGAGLSFFAYGPTVYAVWNETSAAPPAHTGGTAAWTWSAGTTIENFPNPVLLSNGREFLFVGGSDGFLYKIDVATGLTDKSVYVGRATCPQDRLTATPAVQLYAASNATFKDAMMAAGRDHDDLVFVITHNGDSSNPSSGCYAGSVKNRVQARYASDLSPRWIFNSTGVYKMGYGSETCAIDYATNRLYCGTNLVQGQTGQNSLWALNSLSGALVWATNAGSISTRPQYGQGELYAASAEGTLQKWDPAGDGFGNGILLWAYPVGAQILRNPWVEFRPPSPTRVFFVDELGILRGVRDGGTSGVALWPQVSAGGGHSFVTAPAVPAGLGKAYVGRSDGAIQQVDVAGGSLETLAPSAGIAVWDPSADLSSAGAPSIDRLMVPYSTGAVARFCIPWSGTTGVGEPAPVIDDALARSVPNPFSTCTRLSYSLPQAARVEIDVYDVAGHRVRALVREHEGAGLHQAVWNGFDDAGTPVQSGLYFYRLRAVGVAGQTLERSRKVQLVR